MADTVRVSLQPSMSLSVRIACLDLVQSYTRVCLQVDETTFVKKILLDIMATVPTELDSSVRKECIALAVAAAQSCQVFATLLIFFLFAFISFVCLFLRLFFLCEIFLFFLLIQKRELNEMIISSLSGLVNLTMCPSTQIHVVDGIWSIFSHKIHTLPCDHFVPACTALFGFASNPTVAVRKKVEAMKVKCFFFFIIISSAGAQVVDQLY